MNPLSEGGNFWSRNASLRSNMEETVLAKLIDGSIFFIIDRHFKRNRLLRRQVTHAFTFGRSVRIYTGKGNQ